MRHCLPLLLFFAPSLAEAKDLRNRLGIGFNEQFGAQSTLSLRYGLPMPDPVINIHLEGVAGFTQTNGQTGAYFTGGRLLYGIVAEDNMNLFLGGGVGIADDGTSSFSRVEGTMEAQFFLFGLENLGFLTGWGVHVDTGGTSGARTAASLGVGAHYWF